MRQNLLGQHPRRTRPDWPSRLVALDDDCVNAHADELAGEAERRRKAENPRAALFDPAHRRTAREPSSKHNMADTMGGANIDQFYKLRVQGNQVDTEGSRRHRPGCADL